MDATNDESKRDGSGTIFKDLRPRSEGDRRQGPPEAPLFGGLLAEAGWDPVGPAADAHEGWLRSSGLAPDRRTTPRDRRF